MITIILVLLTGNIELPELPSGWRSGILVVDASNGAVLIEENAEECFRPASTVKLVTTLLALQSLGPSYVYRTEILADTTSGNLYLTGSGAPLLSAEDIVRASMETAACLSAGSIWYLNYDTSCFVTENHCPGWDRADWGRTYCPPVEALCIGDNIVEIVISSIGGIIRAWMYPPLEGLMLDYRLVIGSGNTVMASVDGWDTGHPEITLNGSMPADSRVILYKPFAGAPLELTSWLSANLEERGLCISAVREGSTPDDSTLVSAAVMYSQPLFQILASMNKWSRNMVAEQILRTVSLETGGAPGSTGAGCDMAGQMLNRLVPGSTGIQLADGSGLSRLNRLAPIHLVEVIRTGIESLEYGPEFLASLPVNGVDGTLASRMENLPPGAFRGKTGSLSDTCTIAGVLHTSGGRILIIAIMLEMPEGHIFRARQWQDEAVSCLYEIL